MNAAVTLMPDLSRADEGTRWSNAVASLDARWLGGQAPSRAVMAWSENVCNPTVVQGEGMTGCPPQRGFFALTSSVAERGRDHDGSERPVTVSVSAMS